MTPGSASVIETRPQIQCRYCRSLLTLNEDGPEARAAGTDPYQQMRQHILTNHLGEELGQHTYRLGWLIDMMFFNPVTDPQKWKDQILAMVEWFQKEPV